ncbi:hypothetical protein QLX08_006944 [Tetragonisca angustula]|uniref:BAG domain-containing protein n=1 Tax=Tetragonisca angustula TaxID=166442 RepID=A0AAW0ZTD9_9HYME
MDSPVIVDKASEFGEPIDLDRPFSAFPFDDDNFGRRSDIRAHLDDLAARHPEFADHLLGSPWGDIPFHGSFRNRNRDSANRDRNNHQQGYSDEDARSQASGSSAASASSSHGEADVNQNQQNKSANFEQSDRKSQIPQYGLRNTVDIGQHHHNMENPDRGNRGQRSMSAPPENRQSSTTNNQQQPQQQEQKPQGQRYVSRIDITPQQPQQQQQKPQQQSNVRHIPIFVEGRDEPVLPKSFDEPFPSRRESSPFRREPSPTQFHTPPHFQRASPFGQHFGGRHHQWPPHFQESFYQSPGAYEHPSRRQQQTHTFPRQHQQQQYCERQPQQQYYAEKQPQQQYYAEKQPQQQHYEQPRQQKPQQQVPSQQQQPQPQQQQQEPVKPKPSVPKDPLERVALVQKEVDALAEQVKQYTGNSRTDKEYIYLDEMLTRELIKLDDIETEGRDNVRQARKNAIKTIQETISLLESKAPLPSQQALPEEQGIQEEISNVIEEAGQTETMDVDHKIEDQSQTKEPIPLPPGPSSPIKELKKSTELSTKEVENSAIDQTTSQQQEASQPSELKDTTSVENPNIQQSTEKVAVTETEEKKQENISEVNTTEEKKTNVSAEKTATEEKKGENPSEGKKIENVSEDKKEENTSKEKKETSAETKKAEIVSKGKKPEEADQEQQQKPEEKMEVDSSEVKQSPKSKKGKKSKKQTAPVSDKPIPLPAPENTETSAK